MTRSLILLLAIGLCLPLAACRGNACCPPAPSAAAAPCAPPSAGDPMTVYEPPPAPDFAEEGPAPPSYAPSPSQGESSQGEYDAVSADLDRTNHRLGEAERILDEREVELARLRAENEKLQAELDGAPPAGPAPAAPVASPVNVRCSTLAQDLRDMGGLEVVEDGDAVLVRVTDAFRPGSERLKPDARLVTALRDAATALKLHPGAAVSVVGHTDSQPIRKSGWASNTELSLARATTVKSVLADNGVHPSRIAVDGRGEMEPLVSPERSSADQARNRRVEIRIQF